MIYIVALTGGIGSGKTTISNGFKKMGIDVIDSDVIAKNIVHTDPVILSKIYQKFGKNILYENN
ncbi:MAG: dephospho-CoA kinase, partial [Buchnera aphidicola]|nr:dephospho-CoA kinase [Buchnera aphidicola]